MNYYISDLHFGCQNQTRAGLFNYDDRPFENLDEMHRYMIDAWNKKVTNGDKVYILGDVAMRGKSDALIGLVAQLKGKKILLKGNHDQLTDYRYTILYDAIKDYEEITDYVDGKPYKLSLMHYPILCWKDQHRGAILLYGHTHRSAEDVFFQKCIEEMNGSEELSLRRHGGQKIRAINVGACMPYVNYEPRTLKELLEATGNLE